MTLPATGALTASQINAEIGKAETATLTLNDPAVRSLAGKASGAISFADLRGKSFLEKAILTPGQNISGGGTFYGFDDGVFGGSSSAAFGSLQRKPTDGLPALTRGLYNNITYNLLTLTVQGVSATELIGKTLYIDGVGYPLVSARTLSVTTGTFIQYSPQNPISGIALPLGQDHEIELR